jgi:hypothetical protein
MNTEFCFFQLKNNRSALPRRIAPLQNWIGGLTGCYFFDQAAAVKENLISK